MLVHAGAGMRGLAGRAGRLTKGVPRLVIQVSHKLGAIHCRAGQRVRGGAIFYIL